MRGSGTAAMVGAFLCAAWSPPLGAQEPRAPASGQPAESASGASESELAQRSQNPIEDMVSVPVEENLDYGLGPNDRAQSTLKIEPRIPAHVLPSWNIVTRTIIPIMYKPDTMATTGGSSGLGDVNVNPTFFVTQARPGPVIWGVGPDFVLPTATQTSLGAGKWSVGPSVALVVKPKPWTFGFIASNVWSFAGESGRSSVDKGSLQYFIHYNQRRGRHPVGLRGRRRTAARNRALASRRSARRAVDLVWRVRAEPAERRELSRLMTSFDRGRRDRERRQGEP